MPAIVTAVPAAPTEGVMVNGETTVNAAVPEMSPEVAVMVVATGGRRVARPWDPAVFETVAVPVTDDDHVTESVRFGGAQVGVDAGGGELLGVPCGDRRRAAGDT